MKLLTGILVVYMSLIFSCTSNKVDGFILNGNTPAIEDGTKLQLINILDNTVIDSTIVENGKFKFEGQLPFYPINVVLTTKKYKNFNNEYRNVWIEKGEMTINSSQDGLALATSEGSNSDQLYFNHGLSRKNLESRKERLLSDVQFIENNTNSVVSAKMLDIYTTTWGKEKTQELYAAFSNEVKESVYGKSIGDYLRLNKDIKIGSKYEDFSMPDIKGKNNNLSELEGKVVLLEFWASWCGPCRNENPNLVATYNQYHSEGFEIFAVSLDFQKAHWLKAIDEDELEWIHVSELNGRGNKASMIYGINSIPDNFLIDQDGVIIARNLRGQELNSKLSEIFSGSS